jgi:hypothetical protein
VWKLLVDAIGCHFFVFRDGMNQYSTGGQQKCLADVDIRLVVRFPERKVLGLLHIPACGGVHHWASFLDRTETLSITVAMQSASSNHGYRMDTRPDVTCSVQL